MFKAPIEETPVVPIMIRVFDRSLKRLVRELNTCATQAHAIREPKAAAFLETAAEQVEGAREELVK